MQKCPKCGYIARTRSTGEHSQNHHLNGHIQQLAVGFETDFSTMKQYVKIRASLELAYPKIDIGGYLVPISEACATIEQCAMLIEMCHLIASERGISLFEASD